MPRKKTEPPAYRFTTIERRFQLISYRWFDGSWCPAVSKNNDGSVKIRILAATPRSSTSAA
jgi:hypothetical protein